MTLKKQTKARAVEMTTEGRIMPHAETKIIDDVRDHREIAETAADGIGVDHATDHTGTEIEIMSETRTEARIGGTVTVEETKTKNPKV